jgi:CRISPR-associated endonuclease/helicase Cas3
MKVHPKQFAEFFSALWKRDPFPWQTMLAEQLATGVWPAALDLPTAAGKTVCIDAAVYALAMQAERPAGERTAPRRVWFVVDRRIVVDEAFARARFIAERMADPDAQAPIRTVADRLRQLSATDIPLAAARLRGGVLRDNRWARVPSQPAIITSTVDQLGSRLLFRSYGHSRLTASIYAGLAGNDSVIILDEAHCSEPFLQTLRAVRRFRDWCERPNGTPFAVTILSATPPKLDRGEVPFPADRRAEALDHPVLQARLRASKPSRLELKKESQFLPAFAAAAWEFAQSGKKRVGVIVNRVASAAEIADLLRAKAGPTGARVELLTSRIRPYERDALIAELSRYLASSPVTEPELPIILVATQCLEVGADFSLDALVTECRASTHCGSGSDGSIVSGCREKHRRGFSSRKAVSSRSRAIRSTAMPCARPGSS